MLIPRVGEQIGDFELIRRIGAGGMGVVYEAREIATGRRVALKILSPAMTREKNRVRFLREAQAAARLHHPNIVGVYAIRQDAELCYYAMELIDGWALSRVRELLGVAGPSHLPIPELMRTHSDLHVGADPDAATVVEGHGDGAAATGPGTPPGPPFFKGGKGDAPPVAEEEGRQGTGSSTTADTAVAHTEADTAGARMAADAARAHSASEGGGLKSEIRDLKSVGRRRQAAITSNSIMGDEAYVRQVVVMLRDIARALDYAHAQGVTHRDIKPDNLLLDHSGKLHLVDFGLARVMEEDNITLTGELMGTPLYMSPEQVAAGRIGIDHRTDIYSLGVVLYHLLCLQPPFEAPSREALLRAIVVHAPRPLSSRNPAVPLALEAIVHHAMEKDPDRRYATGGEMADDLDRWLEGKPISLRLPGRLERWWNRLPRTTRRIVAGGSVAVLALAAGVVAIILHGRQPGPTTRPAGPAEAIEYAARAADDDDYLRSALWYSEALRRGARIDDISALQLASVYGQLTPLTRRVPLAPGERAWSMNPTAALCALAGSRRGFHIWDFLGDPTAGEPLGPVGAANWLSYDEAGGCIWSVETRPDGDILQLWRPSGEAVASAPLKAAGRIVGLRTASGPNGHTVAVMTPAASVKAVVGAGAQLFDAAIYRIRPGQPPTLLVQRPAIRTVELSYEGRYMAVLSSDEVPSVGYLEGQTPSPRAIGAPGSAVQLVCSTARQELALASPSGDISLTEFSDVGSRRPMQLALSPTGLRALTAPAYMRFSPDGKYLLVVGTDTQSTPPYLRSIIVVDTRTSKKLYPEFGWDAFFTSDSRTLVWWDSDAVTFVDCDESQLADRMAIPMKVAALATPQEATSPARLSEPVPSPVQTDSRARRMVCIEAADATVGERLRVRAWDAQTGESLGVLLEAAELTACTLDPTGRFALARVGVDRPELFAWDLGGAETTYPRCARLAATPASRDDVRLTRGPLVVALSRQPDRTEWSLTDPATLQPVGARVTTRGVVSRWLVSDDASVLLQAATDRVLVWNLHDGALMLNLPLLKANDAVLGLAPTGAMMAVAAPDGGLELRDILASADAMRLGMADRRPAQVRFSPTGRYLAVALSPPGRIAVCRPEPGAALVELDTGGPVYQMEFCFADAMLVVGHVGGRASLWSIPDGRRVADIEPVAQSTRAPGFSPAALPTRIAVRDAGVGDTPPLLATAFANRIEVRPLPRPTQAGSAGATSEQAFPPLCLETAQGVVAMAFPPCADGGSETRPSPDDAPRAGERLLVVTDQAAVRWFDLSVRARTAQEWRQRIAERTGMILGADGRPAPAPR